MTVPSIFNTQAPALPIAIEDPTAGYQNNYSNILRLYFNQIDAFNSAVTGPLGAAYLDAPYIAASDTTSQYATANDTPKLVAWNSADAVNGFTLNPTNTATAQISGVYKIDFSLQFANTDNAEHDVFVWLQVDGVDIPSSSSRFTLAARKSTGDYTYIVGYSSVVFAAQQGNTIGLWWATDQAYISGTQDGIFMEALPAQTTPYSRPANPSAIGSIAFMSRLP